MLLKISKYLNSKEVVTFNYITQELAKTILSQEFPALTDLDLYVSGENAIICVDNVILRIEKDQQAP